MKKPEHQRQNPWQRGKRGSNKIWTPEEWGEKMQPWVEGTLIEEKEVRVQEEKKKRRRPKKQKRETRAKKENFGSAKSWRSGQLGKLRGLKEQARAHQVLSCLLGGRRRLQQKSNKKVSRRGRTRLKKKRHKRFSWRARTPLRRKRHKKFQWQLNCT